MMSEIYFLPDLHRLISLALGTRRWERENTKGHLADIARVNRRTSTTDVRTVRER